MRAASLPFLTFLAACTAPLLAQVNDAHTSKTPPAGPAWLTDFATARAAAIAAHKPIFVYSTKTY